MESQSNSLFHRIRQNYDYFFLISLIFGLMGTILFHRAGMGLNSFLFTIIIVVLFIFITKKLNISFTKWVLFCLITSILLSLSNVLTSSWKLQFLNNIGILLLLDTSLIQLLSERKSLGFFDNIKNILLLPFKAISSIGLIFVEGNRFVKDKKIIKNDKFRNILIGCMIAIPLMVITTALLSSADMLYGKIAKSMFEWLLYRDFYRIIIKIILGTLVCYCLLYGVTKETAVTVKEKTKASPTIGITISSLLLLSYALFCGIQIFYLFAGGIFILPKEFTYADYARQGFFELLTVTGFNITLILICENVFEENKFLKGILTAITACSYIMIASATYRMILYIGAYHLTFLRLLVLLFLLIDSLLLAGIVLSLYNKTFPLFKYCVVVISICYLIFSFSKPDYYIAKYFLAHTDTNELESEDIYFLTTDLSYDAATLVVPLLEKHNDSRNLYQIDKYCKPLISDTKDIRNYNYSYMKAKKLLKDNLSFNKVD
ncbi:DUF4153 domain-containing protein [Herbinix luporum]|uniref:DUF4153 domain-containing protein n=1 Tax=Herbinix luporum TaxID=1679721 RepID=UPI001754E4B3|nr:DUF4173 domain-containing protein [Herbinix luporum]HHT57668.1 DUF4173 domain-containing protein [Herbinix luporum]